MPKLPRLGRRQGGAGRLENRFIGGCRHPGPSRMRPYHSLVVEEAVEEVRKQLSWVLGCEAGGSSLSLRWRGARRGGWLVPISSGAGLGLLRPLRGSLRSGNPTPTARANLAFPNDRGLAPRRRAPPIEAPAGRPNGRWIPIARIVPVFVPSKPLARRRGVLGLLSRFPTALQPPPPRPRAGAMLVPTWGLNCRCSWARRGGVGV